MATRPPFLVEPILGYGAANGRAAYGEPLSIATLYVVAAFSWRVREDIGTLMEALLQELHIAFLVQIRGTDGSLLGSHRLSPIGLVLTYHLTR